ncbi:unnamed protein product [Ilex paraguariensis]|uniref:High chlorophyll fluorescence 153 n=1 Tax=Ilex paraguariensis TaxID=185542 RepID=A0ABC8TM40_9AQUA
MGSLIVSHSTSVALRRTHKSPPLLYTSNPPSVPFSGQLGCRKTRGLSLVTRAGPSTNSYIFAFVFPLSLLAVTIFTSARVADKLDEKFLEELEVNQAILEAEEYAGDAVISLEEEPALPRSRNRPKREAEPSSERANAIVDNQTQGI